MKYFNHSIISVTLLIIPLISSSPSLERISSEVQTRIWDDGTTYISNSEIYYKLDGTLIVRSTEPEEMIIKANHIGEMYIYYPEVNESEYHQGEDLSSEASQFYIFLQGMTEDLGLRNVGYSMTDTEFEDDHSITYWDPPEHMRPHIGQTKLVHEDYRPIYLSVKDTDGEVVQKTYFHDYTEIMDHDFPKSITTIDYQSARDSTVSQTSFSNLKYNEQADSRYFDFEIPADATIRE